MEMLRQIITSVTWEVASGKYEESGIKGEGVKYWTISSF